MLKIILITLALVGILTAAGVAFAKYNGHCAGSFLDRVATRVSRKLDLDAEQQQRLQDLMATLSGLRDGAAERRMRLGPEIDGLLAVPTLDRDRVAELIAERHETMTERKETVIAAFADFSDALQPEQRTRLAEIISSRLEHGWGPPRWAH